MKQIIIHNISKPELPPVVAGYCSTFLCRLRGLTFRKTIPSDHGLLMVFNKDSRFDTAIHMMFVFIDLTVVWFNSNLEVVDLTLARKWRPFYISKNPASYVLELHPDRFHDFEIGDRISITDA